MTQLTVSIEDVSMLDQIKQAISLIRGVSSVTPNYLSTIRKDITFEAKK